MTSWTHLPPRFPAVAPLGATVETVSAGSQVATQHVRLPKQSCVSDPPQSSSADLSEKPVRVEGERDAYLDAGTRLLAQWNRFWPR